MKNMTMTKTEAQASTRLASNLNWYVFGALALVVGLFFITGHVAWMVASVLFAFGFGLTTALVLGGKAAERSADG